MYSECVISELLRRGLLFLCAFSVYNNYHSFKLSWGSKDRDELTMNFLLSFCSYSAQNAITIKYIYINPKVFRMAQQVLMSPKSKINCNYSTSSTLNVGSRQRVTMFNFTFLAVCFSAFSVSLLQAHYVRNDFGKETRKQKTFQCISSIVEYQ